LAQSFSATGTWRVHVDPGNVLDFVALSGNLRGDVRIDPPLFGSASAIVSGKMRIDPFGSFDFTTNERSSGGSFGLTVNATGGGIQFSIPPGMETTSVITFTDLLRNIQPEVPYTFSLSGTLSASLSGTGITGTAYSIANLWTEEFQLSATDHPLPAPVPEPSSLILLGIGVLARFVTDRSRSMRCRPPNNLLPEAMLRLVEKS
jgi:hypothetical protein